MNTPELLSPAGSLKHMRYAFAYGADAVYAGQPRYSLRVRNNEFTVEKLQQAISEAHAAQKKFFIASNLLPHDNKVKNYLRDMTPIIEMQPDALIMADPGLIMLVREKWPEIPVHLSVQANTLNSAAIKFWQSIGLTRVILSRELSIDEIERIRQQCPDMELEVFVHGALCIAFSGRCLLSGYFNHRDANQGACTNSCRWKYDLHDAQENETGEYEKTCSPNQESAYLLEERERPDELMPIEEDEHGTYIMNSKDLRAVQHVQRLTEIGVDSLKIEGRTKSYFYAARTAQIYRQAIDDTVAGRPFNFALMESLDGLANRGYTEGFYRRHVPEDYQNYKSGNSNNYTQRFVGEPVSHNSEKGMLQIEVKNKVKVGDQVELMLPEGSRKFTLEYMEDKQGQSIDVAPGSGLQVWIKIPADINPEYGLLIADTN
ncbi:MAG: tRNA 5-hydroxyuridine modification protein YegQ [Proteobacteria bacterium]|nr:U32 family peptidase [Pseudomonadota bacterium]NOG61680.1 tRNA 5-hydroxyuridine modification protein YegQ [Pseudomonadota bacterium]